MIVRRRLPLPSPPLCGGLFLAALSLVVGCSSTPDATEPAEEPSPTPGDLLASRRGLPHAADLPVQRIAFGACNKTDEAQPLWEPIVASDPDIWIWLGDNVYGDTEDMAVMRGEYEAQLSKPGYRSLLETAEITGTWDDHDFGANNAGREYPMRAESQVELLDFLGAPPEDPRRARAGVYGSHSWGPEGQRVKLILLDARYHRDDPDVGGTILGEEQWRWLESELTGSDAQIHLIAGGIQFLHVDHRYERWDEFPSERQRLLDLLARTGTPGAILLSGDRHISEIAMLPDAPVGYPLYEVTSSGLTHSWDDVGWEENRYRVGELYPDLGFGMIEIDWEARTVSLQLRDPENAIAAEQRIDLDRIGSWE